MRIYQALHTNFNTRENILFSIFVVLVLTLYSFVAQLGYSVYNGDQLIYFPSLLRSLNPQILVNDFMAGFSPNNDFTLYDEIISQTINFTGLNHFGVIFLLTFIARFVFFYALYKISLYFTKDHKFSLFAVLIFIVGFKVYGTGMRTFGSMLLARDVATAFYVLSLAFLFDKKWIISAISLGLGLVWHPSMAIPFLLIFYISLFISFIRSEYSKLTSGIASIIPFVFLYLILAFAPETSPSGFFQIIDQEWWGILMQRVSYNFVTTWYYPNSSPLYIFAGIYFFILLLKELGHLFASQDKSPHLPAGYWTPLGILGRWGDKKRYFYLIFLIPAGLTILSLMAADLVGHAFSFQLQLARSLLLWKLILNLLFTYYVYRYIKDNPKDLLYNFSLCGIILSFIVSEKVMLVFVPLQFFLWTTRRIDLLKTLHLDFINDKSPHLHPPTKILYGGKRPQSSQTRLRGILGRLGDKVTAFIIFLIGLPVLIFFAILNKTGAFLGVLPVIILAAFVLSLIVKYRISILYSLASLPLLAMVLISVILIKLPSFSILPIEMTDPKFIETCQWMKKNTSLEDSFIAEPFSNMGGYIRLVCLRNVFITKKDGGSSMFNRDFAMEWRKRFNLAKESHGNPSVLSQIANEYGIDYVFSENRLNLNYPLVFNNEIYHIYRLK